MFESKSIQGQGSVTISMGRVEDWPISQLRYTCKKNKVKGYTTMTKEALVVEVKKIFEKLDKGGD